MLFGERNKIIHQWFTCITCDVRRAWHHTSNGGNPWNLGQSVMRKHLVVVAYDSIGRLSVFMPFCVTWGLGWGVGWDDNVRCLCWHGRCYATVTVLDVHTWSMLCHSQGGVGWGGVGCLSFPICIRKWKQVKAVTSTLLWKGGCFNRLGTSPAAQIVREQLCG